MDISKIINDSLDKSMKEYVDGKFSNLDFLDDKRSVEHIEQDARLMNYTNILLRTYHAEHKKELSKHGFEI